MTSLAWLETLARRFEAARPPAAELAQAARRLNDLTHAGAARFLDQGARSLDGWIDDAAERLRHAARARDLPSLVRDQLARGPATAERVAEDARATWRIARETGRELSELAGETFTRLAQPARSPGKGSRSRTRPAAARRRAGTKPATRAS